MCTTNIFTYVYPDGRREQSAQPALCTASRYGKACVNNVVFQHPPQHVPFVGSASAPATSSPWLHQMPPTPAYTPRSGTPNYRSGDESDRSFHSSSSRSSQRGRRSSNLYLHGQRVLHVSQRERPSSRSDRIVIVDGPPTPRTPPQSYNMPHTAPSSPNVGVSSAHVIEVSPRSRHSSSRRPVIVDERPATLSSRHARYPSTSSHGSRHSYHSAEEEVQSEERRRRREEDRALRRLQKEADEAETRRLRINERIAKANAEISKRPAVPMAPEPRRSSTYVSRSRSPSSRDAELASALNNLTFEDAHSERAEADRQRQRLVERMMPRRRATVGPGSRRNRVMYDDGVYRWE